ncbi:NAD(P)H-dependent oxidoreductase [Paraconexibacter antarcticus]|uniref:NAD(P)H-dependent oxidoreductase n=1 Tax=Paraconexibacter antarcticus TaxID=2949664 RepID=A0ABY5DWE0_9ACTN|nr:NAD(P)H-dependent oxidoreductase [Paraconexibacter antarcticus]UTI66323.1 NAD(P)H-dependent oxidoreductase [Paraconexibacter antarcticus]
MPPIHVLLISGSLRDGSTNTAVLRTAQADAGPGVEASLAAAIDALPHFSPDADVAGAAVPAPVAALRRAVGAADAVLVCTPEYAGALPAVLKNVLEWTIGDGGLYEKPVAWINCSGPAAPTGGADAHDSLAKVLRYAGAMTVDAACARIPLTRADIGPDGLVADAAARAGITAALATLVAAVPR